MPQLVDPLREMPTCRCELCGYQMKYLGQHRERGDDVRLFRCYECCLVTTESFDPLARAWAKYGASPQPASGPSFAPTSTAHRDA
jgi:hypothetical protein